MLNMQICILSEQMWELLIAQSHNFQTMAMADILYSHLTHSTHF